ncbi:MAG: TolC family protein [Vicinamibacterales bacterium]
MRALILPVSGNGACRPSALRTVALATAVLMAPVAAGAQGLPAAFSGSLVQGTVTPDALSLSLDRALERGLQFNLSLVNIEQQVESARGARVRALRDLLPRVEFRVDEVRQTRNLAAFGFDSSAFPGFPTVVGPFNLFDARVYASQPILDLSARGDIRSKDASLEAARLDQSNARDVVTYVVTNLYFQAVAGESRIQAVRTQVATAEALLAQATALRNAGAAPGIDVIRAQVQVQAQRQRLIAAENDYAKQLLQLSRAIGVPTGQKLQLADSALMLPTQVATVEQALAQAATARDDYKASLARVRSAEATLASTKGSALPSLRVSADYGTIGSNPADARRTYTMSVGVRVPLFDQDRIGRQVENQAALRQRQAEATDMAQRIEAEVRTAFLDVQAAEQQLAVARERVTLANQELSLARTRFTAGVTSNLEVIQAQNEVATAADAEVGATYALNTARAALARSIGGAK